MNIIHDDECTGLAAQTALGVIAIPYCTPGCLFRAWTLIERIADDDLAAA